MADDTRPPPLTPPDCDLRDFPFMPLDVQRLRDSDLAATPEPEAFRAAVLAWCFAWHQLPAGSLPDDDAVLCRHLGYGRDLEGWRAARTAGALHGFTLCSDGRLYHPTVCEKANEAWRRKLMQREKSRQGNLKRWAKQGAAQIASEPGAEAPSSAVANHPSDLAELSLGDRCAIPQGSPPESSQDRKGEGQGQEEREVQPPSEPAAAGAALQPAGVPIRDAMWRDGLPILRFLTGKSESTCRAFLGKLLKATHDDCARVYAVLREAESLRPAEPGAWLMRACAATSSGPRPLKPKSPAAQWHDQYRRDAGTDYDIEGLAEEVHA